MPLNRTVVAAELLCDFIGISSLRTLQTDHPACNIIIVMLSVVIQPEPPQGLLVRKIFFCDTTLRLATLQLLVVITDLLHSLDVWRVIVIHKRGNLSISGNHRHPTSAPLSDAKDRVMFVFLLLCRPQTADCSFKVCARLPSIYSSD